jgi:hypothetical protein
VVAGPRNICVPLVWAARLLSLLSIVVILLIFIGEAESFELAGVTFQEWLGLLFFPFGLALGMIIAWRWELTGGAITIGSLLAFYLVEWAFSGSFPRGPYFMILAMPGLIFIAAGGCQKVYPGNSKFTEHL